MKKPRTLQSQIMSALGKVWMYWPARLAVKKRCKDPNKTGWSICELKGCSVQLIEVDHVKPVVKPTDGFVGWDIYIESKFVGEEFLQGLCHDCHKEKSKNENKIRREVKRNKQ